MDPAGAVRERHGVDRARFDAEVLPAAEPAVLRGVVAHWPAVAMALASPMALLQELAALDSGREADALLLPPGAGRRIFYDTPDGSGPGFNYLRKRTRLAAVCEQLARYAQFAQPPAVAMQSAPVAHVAPGLLPDHTLPLLHAAVQPRLWLGNAIVTPAHFDESHNIACVVAGERRFTLFPPEQVANLHVGPLDHAPTGTPLALPDVDAPDVARYPRFADALAAARRTVLAPGDAIYIPPLWWHNVESLSPVSLLLNYWWQTPGPPAGLAALRRALDGDAAPGSDRRRGWEALLARW